MSWFMAEYICDVCGSRFESLERRSEVPEAVGCKVDEFCGGIGRRVISAGHAKTVWGSAINRGKSDPPPHPMAMDSVGRVNEQSGVTMSKWKQERSKKWRDRDRARRRAKGMPV